MARNDDANTSSPFTNWEWRKIKIKSAPAGDRAAGLRQETQSTLRRRDRHRPLQISVLYRGGPESSWLLGFRGRYWRFPGHMALEDVMVVVNAEAHPSRPQL